MGVVRFRVGGFVGYGGCKLRIKGIDKCKEIFLYNIKNN